MTTPVPVILDGTGWAGNDGNWSVLDITVGTPAQQFFVLPSTTHGDIWVPMSGACVAYNASDCAISRGVGLVDGQQSDGFATNASTSWDSVGLYKLPAEQNLFASDAIGAVVGLDSVTLGSHFPATLHNQTIDGFVSSDFWLGSLGLGLSSAKFDVVNGAPQSVLTSLKTANYTVSMAYGFYAGAKYVDDDASVSFGGYDRARLANAGITISTSIGSNNETSLNVSLRSLQTTNTFVGTRAYPDSTKNLSLVIDPTVAQLWLPEAMCDELATAFGLLYQNDTGYYLLNSTTHDKLVTLDPQLIFTIAADATTSVTTDITLPYAAFDQYLGYPIYASPVRYFPLRRAANDSQLTLGRAFLQEAYLVVDHERQNFTISQATHGQASSIFVIVPPNPPSTGQLSVGAIIGIVIGVLLIICLGVGIAFWLYRRKRRQAIPQQDPDTFGSIVEIMGKAITGEELMSAPVHELPSARSRAELGSRSVHEMVDENSPAAAEKSAEVEVHELPADNVRNKSYSPT